MFGGKKCNVFIGKFCDTAKQLTSYKGPKRSHHVLCH